MRTSNVLMLLIGLLALVGGHLESLIEPTAFLIVIGGTIGAVGLSLFVDNIQTDSIENILYNYVDLKEEKYEIEYSIFESAGGFAPTMGIIGTVMGLVHVSGNLDDPNKLGPQIAVAFIATLYGVASANLLWLSLSMKIKEINKKRLKNDLIVVEGILCLVEGVSNVEIEERLSCLKEDVASKIKKVPNASFKDDLVEA